MCVVHLMEHKLLRSAFTDCILTTGAAWINWDNLAIIGENFELFKTRFQLSEPKCIEMIFESLRFVPFCPKSAIFDSGVGLSRFP